MPLRGRLNLANEQFFFVTTTVIGFTDIFTEDIYCDLLIRNIKYYKEKYHFVILAYVIMPTHFHWIVKVEPVWGTISDVMRDIKKYSAWDIMDEIEKRKPSLLNTFKNAAVKFPKQKRKFWMHRFDDEVIRNEKMYWTKFHYIHHNPVKAGLVKRPEDYKYSSARNYVWNDHPIIEVDTSFGGVELI